MIVYISGPMSNYENYNYDAFAETEKRLKEKGHYCINPHDIAAMVSDMTGIAIGDLEYYDILKLDMAFIRFCDCVLMLQGWEKSQGAISERQFAINIDKGIFYDVDEVEEGIY
jgi:hypothetical protein